MDPYALVVRPDRNPARTTAPLEGVLLTGPGEGKLLKLIGRELGKVRGGGLESEAV